MYTGDSAYFFKFSLMYSIFFSLESIKEKMVPSNHKSSTAYTYEIFKLFINSSSKNR